MRLLTATGLNRWLNSAEAKTLHAGQLNIGPRLVLGFVLIILSMLAADALILWQFHLVRTQAERLNGIDQRLVAVLRLHTSLTTFHDRLEYLADSQDIGGLVTEGERLRTAVLEASRSAMSAFSLAPFDFQRDPTILPLIDAVQIALPAQLEAITTLANAGDWRAVRQRLANQVTAMESVALGLVERVDHEVGEEQAQTVRKIERVQRLFFLVVPLTAVVTLLIAGTFGLAITRSITQPLARLVEGSKALARGDFQHEVAVTGRDELADLGRVFNDTSRRLQDLYATLQQSENRLRLVIDTIPAYAWSARPDGSVDFINQRFLEFTARSAEGMIGWGWSSVVYPDDLARYIGDWQAAVATGKPMESEARVRRMDGDYRWLLIRNVPLRNELGNIVNWYGTAIDIEERHRAEDALRLSEAYLAEAQRLSHTGSWALDGTTREALYWSEEMFRIFGFDPQQGFPERAQWLQRIHPEDRDRVKREASDRMFVQKVDSDIEYRIVLPDGTVKLIHGLAHPVLGPHDELIEVVGTVVDITEHKHAEEARDRLRQLEADLAHINRVSTMGELTASLAHEIKQPIGAAVTNAEACVRLLDRKQPDLPEAREAALEMVKDSRRAADIVDRVRLLYQKGSPQLEIIDINELVKEMVTVLHNEANRHSVVIRSDHPKGLPAVMADRVQVQQALMNLMLNGIEAMQGTGGELHIKSQLAEDGQVLISVTDTGVGLPTEKTDQIFNAFFTTKPHGTGLGLAITRSIVESHGGRIWATANSGPGTTFRFTLPQRRAAHA